MNYKPFKLIELKKFLFLFLSIVIIFGLGFASGLYKTFPYQQLRQIKQQILLSNNPNLQTKLQKCEIKHIDQLPESFSVVIGHAYGSPKYASMDGFIAEKVDRFLLINEGSINSVIFTGDVFYIPASLKWKTLYKKYNISNIFIAPGNHDKLQPNSKEIFLNNHFIPQPFPYKINVESFNIFIDDSVMSSPKFDKNLKDSVNNFSGDEVLIARHHVPISDLSTFSNDTEIGETLPKVEDFLKLFPNNIRFTWLIGDGGAFKRLPRLTCHKFQNHRFIINGIGEVENDTVLILENGELFAHIITDLNK